MSFSIRVAQPADLDTLVPLFDGYRGFYGQASDPERARIFLGERLQRADSMLLLATDEEGMGLGFTQLYPSFTSIGTARIEILNDLFVVESARRLGVARALLQAAEASAHTRGARKLILSTAVDNRSAQALYVAEGWVRDDAFVEFAKPL